MAQCAAPKTSGIIRKSSRLRDREVPPAGGSRRGARLRGNGDRGTCLTEGGSFTPPSSGFNGEYDKQSACSLMVKTLAFCRARELPSHSLQSFKKYKLNLSKFVLNLFADFVQSFFFDAGNVLPPLCRRGSSNNEIFFKISEND